MQLPKLPTQLELKNLSRHINDQIHLAHSGNSDEISWLSQSYDVPIINGGNTTQIIVIGGSFIRSTIVIKGALTHTQTNLLPLLGTKADLLDIIFSYIQHPIESIILNIAFPIQPEIREDKLDGILIRGSKNHQLHGLIGKQIGKELELYLQAKLDKKIAVFVHNDIFGLLLHPRARIAGIVGTGINIGIKDTLTKSIINLEPANIRNFPRIKSSEFVDAQSRNPGTHCFEKEIGGGYLWQHFNYFASQENIPLISATSDFSTLTTSQELLLAQFILQRSAYLYSTILIAVHTILGGVYCECIMEGGIFWEMNGYEKYINQGLILQGFDPKMLQFTKPSSVFRGSQFLIGSPLI